MFMLNRQLSSLENEPFTAYLIFEYFDTFSSFSSFFRQFLKRAFSVCTHNALKLRKKNFT